MVVVIETNMQRQVVYTHMEVTIIVVVIVAIAGIVVVGVTGFCFFVRAFRQEAAR